MFPNTCQSSTSILSGARNQPLCDLVLATRKLIEVKKAVQNFTMRSLNFTGGLIPHLIDQRAESTPNAIFAEYPISTLSYAEGYRRITYTDLANAVDAAAHWLVSTLDRSQEFETLAYIGPNDLRYPALIVGAVKAGYKV